MKIKEVRFENHPVLGNLTLDFTDPATGSPAHTVVLAGGNGCGKTLVLNEIYTTLGEITLDKNNGKISIVLELDENNVGELRDRLSASEVSVKDRVVHCVYEGNSRGASWMNLNISFARNDGTEVKRSSSDYLSPQNTRSPIRIFLSEADVNFPAKPLESIGASQLDLLRSACRSGTDLARQISQLLIDIRAADNEELAVWTAQNPMSAPDPTQLDKRMKRFRDAIEFMFPNKKLKTITRTGGKHRVDFEEYGRTMSLDELSTGEKQIIFRGGFVLRDLANIQGGVLLIDEPELSLHPEWQAKIVGFYQRLLPQTPESGSTTQIVFATHSPFIVHDAFSAKVIVIKKDPMTGNITVDPEPSYPTSGATRLVQTFNVEALLEAVDASKPIVLVEGKTDASILDTAWQKLHPGKPIPFELVPCGVEPSPDDRSGGAETLRRCIEFLSIVSNRLILGIFDNDRAGNEQFNGLNKAAFDKSDSSPWRRRHKTKFIQAILLPVPTNRSHFVSPTEITHRFLSIEHFFSDELLASNGLKGSVIGDSTIFEISQSSAAKVKFAEDVKTRDATTFDKFASLFDRVETCLGLRT